MLYTEIGIGKINIGIGLLSMDGRGKLPVFHLQKHLRNGGNACCRFQVADIGFDRTDGTGLLGRICFSKYLIERINLDGISQLGPCAVRLDIREAACIHSRLLQRLGDQADLGIRIRNGITADLAAMVDSGRLNHAIDMIFILNRFAQRL